MFAPSVVAGLITSQLAADYVALSNITKCSNPWWTLINSDEVYTHQNGDEQFTIRQQQAFFGDRRNFPLLQPTRQYLVPLAPLFDRDGRYRAIAYSPGAVGTVTSIVGFTLPRTDPSHRPMLRITPTWRARLPMPIIHVLRVALRATHIGRCFTFRTTNLRIVAKR